MPCVMPASAGSSTSARIITKSSTTSQPTAMRPRSVSISRRSCKARSSTTVLATDSAKPNTTPAPIDQPREFGEPHAQNGGAGDLGDGTGDGDGVADREQVLQREVEANAEHEQNNADFSEIGGELLIGHVAWRERTDQHAREQIAS